MFQLDNSTAVVAVALAVMLLALVSAAPVALFDVQTAHCAFLLVSWLLALPVALFQPISAVLAVKTIH